jgi:hypothetical protein
VALAGLIAVGLLGDEFDRRSLLVVLAVVVFPDLDAFAGFLVAGGHRSVLHSLLIPLAGAVVLYVDTHRRGGSFVRGRWGTRGVRIAWTSLACYAFAAIGLDLFAGGVNLLYPLHDQFYQPGGRLFYSTGRGLVQTFVEFDFSGRWAVEAGQRGSSEDIHVATGVDPNAGGEPENVERIFPVANAGWELLLLVVSPIVVAGRLYEDRWADEAGDESGGAAE